MSTHEIEGIALGQSVEAARAALESHGYQLHSSETYQPRPYNPIDYQMFYRKDAAGNGFFVAVHKSPAGAVARIDFWSLVDDHQSDAALPSIVQRLEMKFGPAQVADRAEKHGDRTSRWREWWWQEPAATGLVKMRISARDPEGVKFVLRGTHITPQLKHSVFQTVESTTSN